MNHRTRQRKRTIDDITEAAELAVLDSTRGVEGITIQQIADAIGLTPGALYRYFPSRDAIIASVQLRVISSLIDRIDAAVHAVEEGEDRDLERLFAVVSAVILFARTSPRRYGLLSRMLAVPSPLIGDSEAAEVLPRVLSAISRVEALFSQARRSRVLSDGQDRERLVALWAAVHGAIQLDKLSRFSEEVSAERIAASALEAIFLGWGADRAALSRVILKSIRRS